MKKSLRKELFKNIAIMMALIAVIVIAGIASVLIQKRNFNRIIVEYHEINAIYDLSYSLKKAAESADNYLLLKTPESKIDFQNKMSEMAITYQTCFSIITERHSKEIFLTMEEGINRIINKTQLDISKIDSVEQKNISIEIDSVLYKTDNEILAFQAETRKEIEEYIEIDNKISRFSIFLIIFIGLIIIIGSLFWGLSFVNKRTAPIIELIDFTQQIGKGNLNLQADIKFGNELDLLTISFNNMLKTLNQTTISKDYLNNIINSIVDFIIVTDQKGTIKLINSATVKTLGYEGHELIENNIMVLFPNLESGNNMADFTALSENDLNQNDEFVRLLKVLFLRRNYL